MQLFLVTLAPAANQKMQPLLDTHRERHWLVHRFGKNPHHLATFRRVFPNENDKLRLQPVSPREHGWVINW
jgi:hypothetical protein